MQLDQQLTARLCQNSVFEGLSPEQIRDILPCITSAIKSYNLEECIYHKGDPVQGLGVVLEGTLLLCDETPDGKLTAVANLEENQLLGEVMLFSTESNLSHRVLAGKNSKVLFLSKDFFSHCCGKSCPNQATHQDIIKNMFRILSDRAVTLNKKLAYLSAPDLKTKIAMYLYELYQVNGSASFTMPLNRDRLAEFFSVARPSLSRELINLKNMGIIDFHRSHVEIRNLDALYELSKNEVPAAD